MDAATLDLTGGKLNIACVAGDDVAFDLPTPSNLSAWTWTAQIRARADPAEPVLGSFTFTLTSSAATCRIAHTVTRTLPSRCVYDMQVSLAGVTRTLLAGAIEITPDVTA